MNIREILSEGPYDSPNKKHVSTISDKDFLKMMRHEVLARLLNSLNIYYEGKTYTCDDIKKCLKDYTKSVDIIGGFLTKFAVNDSDIDVNVILKDKMLNIISPDHNIAIKEIMDYFRDDVNGKKLGNGYDYVINYFFVKESPHFIRHNLDLLNKEIDASKVHDRIDSDMVDVTEYLSREKFEQYIFKPLRKAINITRDMINRREFDRCGELKEVYSITERIGGDIWKEFDGFNKDLKWYNFTSDNLRYKALSEKSDLKKFLTLCQHDKLIKLKHFLVEKDWNLNLGFEKSLNKEIVKKVLKKEKNINESATLRPVKKRSEAISIDTHSLGDFLYDIRNAIKSLNYEKFEMDLGGNVLALDKTDLIKYKYLIDLYKKVKEEEEEKAKIKKAINAYRISTSPFSNTNGANDYNRY